MKKNISIIIPVYNEEKYIERCLDSVVEQTYPKEQTEVIVVDGMSTDKTREMIEAYRRKINLKLLDNEKRIVTYALNLAIQNATGDYIIRLDAHAEFGKDYIEKCVYYLDTTDADNVGGVAETSANGFVGHAISQMLSTKFGVGGSDFRVGNGNQYVGTVPFGAFRKEVFERVGLFNTKLPRSEDNDMNARIRESGGKIWLAEDIRFRYFCRDTVKGILKMGLQNGNALFHTLRENPKAMSIRHFIPFAFLVSLVGLPLLSLFIPAFWWVLAAEMIAYFLLDLYFSFLRVKPAKCGFVTIWLYPLFHIFYGVGSLLGLVNVKLY